MNPKKKSVPTAGILAFLFGPLGLLYSSPVAAIILGVFAVAFAHILVVPFLVWIIGIPIALSAAEGHNKDRQEFIDAMSKREAK